MNSKGTLIPGLGATGPLSWVDKLLSSQCGASDKLIPRWIFLRALGFIYFSAFYALLFQVRGLIGPVGVLPAREYLDAISNSSFAHLRFWYAPSLLWASSDSRMLMALCWAGLIGSVLLVLNLWPRGMLVISFVCFLSFVAAAQDFSGYQSDGMLLEAGFISLFFAPGGLRPGLGRTSPPSRFSLLLLQWEWFRIYFESGIVKLASGEPQWRNFTAMDEYYQNGPLPTWIGWYLQHLPHWFHAATVAVTLLMELVLVWMILLPRRFRIVLFFIVTLWQAGVILTANYAFLNYLVLSLGILLLDDRFIMEWLPKPLKSKVSTHTISEPDPSATTEALVSNSWRSTTRSLWRSLKLGLSTAMLVFVFYVTTTKLILVLVPRAPLPLLPVTILEPFRIANQYGLFAVMTRARYEIEFQGSNDGENWIAYPFRYKPQALNEPPKIYAPYQPRFDWNLWFASLGDWRSNAIVPYTQIRLLSNERDVLSLFAANPFSASPPKQVRAVLWQYWFTTLAEKRMPGNWWRREFLGLYAPTLEMRPDGKISVVEMPETASPRQ